MKASFFSYTAGKKLALLLLACCALTFAACAGTQTEVRGQYDFATGVVKKR